MAKIPQDSSVLRSRAGLRPEIVFCGSGSGQPIANPRRSRFPGPFQGSLEMNWLDAQEWQRRHREEAKRARAAVSVRWVSSNPRRQRSSICSNSCGWTNSVLRMCSASVRRTYASPPVIPDPKFKPAGPNTATMPPVIYSQPCWPTPSTTATAPAVAHRKAFSPLAPRRKAARKSRHIKPCCPPARRRAWKHSSQRQSPPCRPESPLPT